MRSGGTGGGGSMRSLSAIACFISGLAALGLSFLTWMDVSMYGFPDSHLTDYQKATTTPLQASTWISAAFGVTFLVLAFAPLSTRARTIAASVSLLAFALVAITARVGIPWYFGTHLGLDNGFGG